jgi:hypothetical protein
MPDNFKSWADAGQLAYKAGTALSKGTVAALNRDAIQSSPVTAHVNDMISNARAGAQARAASIPEDTRGEAKKALETGDYSREDAGKKEK